MKKSFSKVIKLISLKINILKSSKENLHKVKNSHGTKIKMMMILMIHNK